MIRILTVAAFLIFTGFAAHAGPWAQACSGHGKEGQGKCAAAQGELKAKDAARSASRGGTNINVNAGRLAADAAAQKADVEAAKAKCKQAREECEQKCDGEKDKARPMSQLKPCTGLCPIAKNDIASLIDIKKKSDCTAPITAQEKLLEQASKNLGNDKNAADDTGKQSQGGPPQIPPIQPPQKEEKEKKEEEKLACEGDEGARYSDCNAKYVAKCNDRMNESGCETFANRYCGAASVGASVKNYVADKSGEGLGSGFCKGYTAYKFCKSVERSECPSCRGSALHSSPECQANPLKCVSSAQLSEAKNKCPSDPIFLDPAVLAAANGDTSGSNPYKNNEPVSTAKGGTQTPGAGSGGASGGVGAGGALPGAGQAVGLPGQGEGMNGAVPESLPGGNASAVGSGSAGNYGEGSVAEEEENRDPAATGLSEGVLPASAVEGMPARDVSNQYGPNLFSISTQVYRNLCAAEKLSTCVQRRK